MVAVVVLTGAGISAESGIQTFRGNNGLWESHRIEEVASPEGFARNPEMVQRFYNERRRQLQSTQIKPNAAHSALADFERAWGDEFLLVTQNVDDLHERAGSQRMLHMHGELMRVRCQSCETSHPHKDDILADSRCTACDAEGELRPDVVWFGEMPLHMDTIAQALARCDLFVSIGTSGQVYPAAGFAAQAAQYGARTVEINLEQTAQFDDGYYGLASEEVPQYFERLLEGRQA